MNDIALRVEGLSKRYRLGLQENTTGGFYRYKSLRDSLGGISKHPLKTLKSAVVADPMDEENSFWALKDINFEVKRGEVVGIIGRNGAGKSTLLKILSRITKPTTGRVDLFGRVGSLLEVGTGFHPELSGRENIYLNGAILGMTKAEISKQFDEIVAFSEIEKFLDMAVKQYSSGMYTRLAFAVAAHLDPEILIVDEVLAVGDAAFQMKCMGRMKKVAEEGRTVLFVSHNLSQIERLCETGVLLQQGKVIGRGPVIEQVSLYSRTMAAPIVSAGQTLVKDIKLVDIVVQPASVRSKEACTVSFTFRASSSTTIDDLCLLICVEHDMRVAAIDLKGVAIPLTLGAGDEHTFTVSIPNLPLVEREYSLGLFLRSWAGFDAVYGLTTFEVTAPRRIGISPVYGPTDRGFTELDYVSV